jgi:membrane carboxypeptidase/penicillin-binding protein
MLTSPLVRRRRRARRRGVPGRGALAQGLLAVLGLAGGLTSIGGALLFSDVTRGLPAAQSYPERFGSAASPRLEATRFYDRSGEVLIFEAESAAAAGRRWIHIESADADRLPTFAQATLAFQEPQYWSAAAYDWSGILAALVGRPSAPRIADQLVEHTLLPLQDAGLAPAVRRLRAAILAADLTRRFGKAQILEWFLNTADYGNLAYGIDAAALTYLGKHAGELSLSESALLAGIPAHPATNPFEAPAQSRALRDEVLSAMRRAGFISAAQESQAKSEAVVLRIPADSPPGAGADYGRYAWAQLTAQWGEGFSRWGGLTIVTAEEHDLQLQTECVAATHLRRLQGADPAAVTPAADGSTCLAAGLLPALRPSDAGTDHRVDGVAAMVMDPATGQVLSMVGDVQAARPAGAALQPLTYLAAFSRGYGPGTMVLDLPLEADSTNLEGYRGPVSMRSALAAGLEAAAAQTMALAGTENVARIAAEMGFERFEGPAGSHAGAAGWGAMSVEEGARAYAVLANDGRWVGEAPLSADGQAATALSPITILRIEDSAGRMVRSAAPASRALVSAPLAFLVNDVLSDETERRSIYGATDVLELGRPAAVVVEAGSDGRDTWAIGYTRRRVVAVWLGGVPPAAPTGMNRLNGAAPVWHALLQYAGRDQPPQGWSMPAGVHEVQVCVPSGLLPTQYCPRIVREVFIDGTEPTSYDALYQPLRVNRETGKLATLFTPIDLVEERVYLMPPAAASAWAQASGIEKPPTEYDTYLAGETGTTQAHITRPEMFETVRGRVTLRGAANMAGFEYYRLQYGQGLNPARWIQIGGDTRTAVSSGTLAVWDTAGLEGLYTVQLVVVYGEGQVITDAVQVTVDNAAPRIRLILPQPGTADEISAGDPLLIEAEVFDEMGVARVDFLVDGETVGSLSAAPWSLRWEAQSGAHAIRVRALDLAGNLGESPDVRVVIPR